MTTEHGLTGKQMLDAAVTAFGYLREQLPEASEDAVRAIAITVIIKALDLRMDLAAELSPKPEEPDPLDFGESAPNKEKPEPPSDPIWPWNPHKGTSLSDVPTEALEAALKARITVMWRERITDDIAVRRGAMPPAALAARWIDD